MTSSDLALKVIVALFVIAYISGFISQLRDDSKRGFKNDFALALLKGFYFCGFAGVGMILIIAIAFIFS